jgi:hypothetical protein
MSHLFIVKPIYLVKQKTFSHWNLSIAIQIMFFYILLLEFIGFQSVDEYLARYELDLDVR